MHDFLMVLAAGAGLVMGFACSARSDGEGEVNPREVVSPEVGADRRVVFRLLAPKAAKVSLTGAFGGEMAKAANGLWSATKGPLDPGIYSYGFDVDGVPTVDPRNPNFQRYAPMSSTVEVPGKPSADWELRPVKHGSVHAHWYTSKGLGVERRFHVYTPPGYSASREKLPVLCLLHGWGDDDSAWTAVGRAHFILDSLIAKGLAKPMIVVMPHGHTFDPFRKASEEEVARFAGEIERELLEGVLPEVEARYRVRRDRGSRAICGLSMGGWQSSIIGLGNLDRFAWVGLFSAGRADPREFETLLPEKPKQLNTRLRLLWIGCGKDDFLYQGNVATVEMLTSKGVALTWRQTEGGHSWPIWRAYLSEFAPLLFR